jgi:hypothetical protein
MFLALAGCVASNPFQLPRRIKPPPIEEKFDLPPEADNRYSQPPQFPKGTLNKDNHKKDLDEPDGLNAPGKTRFGGMSGGGGGP